MTLPRQVVIGHRRWKVRETRSKKRDGLCDYETHTLWIKVRGQRGFQQANTLRHEILHAAFHEGELTAEDSEERIVSVLANILTQVDRDNPDVIDWIAEKARS
jgi:hypothetical protein